MSAPYDWAADELGAWPAGFTLYRNPDGYDWTISLPADAEPGCLDAAITEALCIDEALGALVVGTAARFQHEVASARLQEARISESSRHDQ